MHEARFIVGIDFGTTNITVAYTDTRTDSEKIVLFPIPQLSAPGEIIESELLPAFCFFPDKRQLREKALDLPWKDKTDYAVGLYARDFGPDSPGRFFSSVKSWLCHAGINRREKILPWNSDFKDCTRSPVEISRYYLEHIRNAWDHKFKRLKDGKGYPCLLADQQVVITVPASFDETARELTFEAAELAGFKDIYLLEEPLAVFYSWLDKNSKTWKKKIRPEEKILVIDVGGGTCDFSIIEMNKQGLLVRSAAGSHLLLGGDNIDMAIARKIETRWKTHLSPGEWAALCQRAREAKEKILNSSANKIKIALLSQGSSVVGNVRESVLRQSELMELLMDGFFPNISIDSPSPKKKSGIQIMGLPYVSDPALTKHLLDFLRYSAKITKGEHTPADLDNSKRPSPETEILVPDKVLFNGGTMIPPDIREQILKTLSSWFSGEQRGDKIEELKSNDLTFAVAYGAAYYGRTRRGEGIKVKSGTSSAYYVEVTQKETEKIYICVIPRGMDEGKKIMTPRKFLLDANQKVSFPLFSSSTRPLDKPGDVLDSKKELSAVSRLINVLRFGRTEKRSIETEIAAELTDTGILKLWIESLQSQHKWPLNFDIRALVDGEEQGDKEPTVMFDSKKLKAACTLIKDIFKSAPEKLPSLVKIVKQELGVPGNKLFLPVIRELADTLLQIPYDSLRIPQQEIRWLNFCGYCLRPGFSDPVDELRLKKAWNIWIHGLNNGNSLQAEAEWWIFWRRIAPGLSLGQQRIIYQVLYKLLCPKGQYALKLKKGIQVKTEMWRCLGALELLSPDKKLDIGDILLSRSEKLLPHEYWVLARLGTRRLFRSPVNNIIPTEFVEKWLSKLIGLKKAPDEALLFAVSRIAAKSGDRNVDISPDSISSVKKFLLKHKAANQWIKHLEVKDKESEKEQTRILGDSLPLGLKLIN